MRRSLPLDFEPREVCERCGRPARTCYCVHLTNIPTKTHVVLLQHPREEDMAIGTARMASLCLPNSELHVGVRFDDVPALARPDAVLLYPGEDAIDVLTNPPTGPVTLVVVDGTWWQARKLVRSNPALAALPRYAFRAPAPSEYRIRREPDEAYVSTIEALVHVLGVLEGDHERMQGLLTPFRAMIDRQIEFATSIRGHRKRHNKPSPEPRRLRVPRPLAEHPERLVCVTAEANAWPYRDPQLRTSYREELVHWLAVRPATGEVLDCIVAPRNPLAPSTPPHIGLEETALLNGESLDSLFAKWDSFVREDDVICAWGHYPIGILRTTGGPPPKTWIDIRQAARVLLRGRVGTMDAVLEKLSLEAPASLGRGRAGLRGAQLATIVRHLSEQARM